MTCSVGVHYVHFLLALRLFRLPRPSLARTLPVAKLPDTTTSLPSSSSRIAPVRLGLQDRPFVIHVCTILHNKASRSSISKSQPKGLKGIYTYACHSYLQIA